MAGGEGSRLRPLTSNQPKPMLPLANKPMMEHIVALLKRHGFDDIVVTLAFMPNAIRTYFGDGSEYGVRMVYATEEQPLGTAGSVRNAMDELDERFLANSKRLFGAVAEGYWEDVGTLEAYVRAHKDALDGKVALDIAGFQLEHGVWLGEGAEIHPEARVEGPAVIGENCRVEAGARL